MPQGMGLSANDVEGLTMPQDRKLISRREMQAGKDKRTMLIGNAGGLKDTDILWAAKAVFGEYDT